MVSQRVTFGPPRQREDRAFPSRVFTNSNNRRRGLERDRAGLNPARGLNDKNFNEPRTASAQDETNREVVPERAEVAMEADDIIPVLDG